MTFILVLLIFLVIIIPLLLLIATLTLLERKIMAAIQIRRGPNIIGFGILQPLADGVKLLIKELIIPLKGNKWLFLLSPVLFLSLSLSTWSILPFEEHYVASHNLTILVFLAFSSLSVYGILLGGWASNSRYAFLGALRSASQMISYELVLSLLVLLVCILAQSFTFVDIVNSQATTWFIIPLAPFTLVYFIAILAETNRTPFDLPEAEAELVAGYSVEYSSGPFAFYFIAEYCNLITWSFTTGLLFLGGWLGIISLYIPTGFIIFGLKSIVILCLFCCLRAALPRYRWDQLMTLAWRAFLPIVLFGCFFVYSSFSLSAYLPFDYLFATFRDLIDFLIFYGFNPAFPNQMTWYGYLPALIALVRSYVLNEDISPAYEAIEAIEVYYSIEGWQTVVKVIVIFVSLFSLSVLHYPLHEAPEEFHDLFREAMECIEHIWRGE